MTQKNTWWGYALAALSVLTVALYAAIFAISPLNGEDYALTRQFGDEGILSRLVWIAERSQAQISTWNARLGEQLAIFWLSLPGSWFLIAAVLTFLLLNLLVCGLYGRKALLEKTAISICIIFALWPGYEVFFWRTVHAGYLQPVMISLLCLFFYRDDEAIASFVASKARLALVSIVALLAGLSFENTAVGILIYMLVSFWWLKNKRANLLALLPMAALTAGWLLLITAPSTAVRRAYYLKSIGVGSTDLVYYLGRLYNVQGRFFSTTSPLFIAALIAGVFLWRRVDDRKRFFLMLLPALLVSGSVVAAPYTEARAFLLAWAIMLGLVVEGIYQALQQYPRARIPALLLFTLGLAFPLHTYPLYVDFASKVNARDAAIKQLAGTPACARQTTFALIRDDYRYKYLNNRDVWVRDTPEFMRAYYRCDVVFE
ncbi:hypothetical protein IGB42_01986 [Andreprevotia sp. IGB-42]|uniref:DUF6056 family protein n=1 Tax=Andreprevotia sp. IGB-42 TaxID=2497473 RepID=UPI001359A80C|nr:DUF6056 family protein [Andreprevotia sp. IGB-42]KAF0813635.1 hypothetical protein IGB42_01986 [Andreprevotia sp. IGB-42]